MLLDKSGCLSAPPKSPASTAGYSTPATSFTPSVTPSIILDSVRNEATVLNKVTWKYPLTTPRDVARLSRAICHNNTRLIDRFRGTAPLVAWRLFQACDKGYNGFVIADDVNRVIASLTSTEISEAISFHHDSSNPVMLWDLMVWWRSLKRLGSSRQVIEKVILNDLVVPSDGLWAGIGLNATVRVWKNVCRCVGYLFRYHAENALSRPFQSVRDVHGRADVVLYLIREALSRISERAVSIWDHMFGAIDLSMCPLVFSAEYINSKYALEADDSSHFVDYLELLSSKEIGLGKISTTISTLPGTRDPPKGFKEVVRSIFRPANWRNRRGKFMNEAISPIQKQEILRFLIRQYLDIEQWRGQYLSTLDVNED